MISFYFSLISSDIIDIKNTIQNLEPYCEGFHLHIMDFHFAPDLEWSIQAVNKIRQMTSKKIHVHLMVEYPEKYIQTLELHAYDIVTIHIESPSTESIEKLLQSIQVKQCVPGIALNPFTPLEAIMGIQFPLQHVVLMSASYDTPTPQFLPHSLEKVKQLNRFKKSHNLPFDISVDGGITFENLSIIIETQPNEIVLASHLFVGTNKAERLKTIIELNKTS